MAFVKDSTFNQIGYNELLAVEVCMRVNQINPD